MDPHKGRHRLLLAFVVLLAFISYAGHVDMYFVKDDFNVVLFVDEHGDGQFDVDEWWGQFMWPTERTWDDLWRPIPALTWAAEFLVFGADPTALHIGQILLHALCCVLLYWTVNRLTRFRNPLAGFFAGAMFAVYPLHPEAILWLTQRTVLMGLAFSLAAIIHFDVWLHRGRKKNLAWAFICVILGTLSREHALPLPAVFCVQAMLMGPRRPFGRRVVQCLAVTGIYALFVAAYFGCRYAIWQRFTGPYSGYATNWDYAVANRVFERFWGETVMACVVPANWHWFAAPVFGEGDLTWYHVVTALLGSFAGLAMFRLIRALFRREGSLGFLAVALTFTFVSWIPVWEVFWIDRNLLNSRSGYHLVAFLVALLATGLIDPWSRASVARKATWRVIAATGAALLYAVVLQVNLRSWTGGDAQVRGMQEALLAEAADHGRDRMLVVFDVPTEYHGCTTIDAYLPTMMGRPFVDDPVPAFPFPATAQRWHWFGPGISPDAALAKWRGRGRDLRFYKSTREPVGVTAMFGATEPAQGDAPPKPVFPLDGELAFVVDGGGVVHPVVEGARYPDGISSAFMSATTERVAPEAAGAIPVRAGDSLLVEFEAAPGLSRFVLHLDIPERQLPIPVIVGVNARRTTEGRVRVRLADIMMPTDDGRTAPLWPPIPGAFPGLVPVMWRVEAQDAQGRGIGLSETRRLVIIDARTSR